MIGTQRYRTDREPPKHTFSDFQGKHRAVDYNSTALRRFQNDAREKGTSGAAHLIRKKKNTSAFLSNQKTQLMSDSYELSIDSLNSKFQSTSKKATGNIYSVGRLFSKFISPESHSPSDSRMVAHRKPKSRMPNF